MTAFLAPPAWSDAVSPAPRAIAQLRIVKYSGVVPKTVVVQVSLSEIA